MPKDRYKNKGHCVHPGGQCQETGTEVRDIASSQVDTNVRKQVQKEGTLRPVRWTPMLGDRFRSKGHCVQSGGHQCQETGTEIREIAYSQVKTNVRRQVQK